PPSSAPGGPPFSGSAGTPAPGTGPPPSASPVPTPVATPVPTPTPLPVSHVATAATVPISQREQPTFTWDAGNAAWIRHEATATFVDENGGGPILTRTLIVQQVDVRTAPQVRDVVGELGVSHNLVGTGPAQIFVNGAEYDATWAQPAIGPAQFTLTNGTPAPISAGLIWVCLVPTGSPAAIR
ncbi:MAG: DUF3048 C-terminal domain-containing protein, partial [Candidatus Dormibacteria bacterium]